jgi:ABC-2 type transport system ATP-binding protein
METKNAMPIGSENRADAPEFLILDSLHKRFGSLVAVDGVSLTVRQGEVLGFIGPNGSGKSTTMKMATGFLEPDRGTVNICGIAMSADSTQAKQHVGYLPEGAPAYADMSPAAFLRFIAEIRGIDGKDIRSRIDDAVGRTELEAVMDRPIETLSKGFKRRVGLAQAILHRPDVLILDEPTDGLDPNQKQHVRSLIADMASHTAIVISTHILEEVEAVCSRVLLIDRGRVIVDGTAPELQATLPNHNAVVVTMGGEDAAAARTKFDAVESIAGIETIEKPSGEVALRLLPTKGQSVAREVAEIIAANKIEVSEFIVEQGSLDDAFRELTTSDTSHRHA